MPDLYYSHGDNVVFSTSARPVTYPFGTILLDTDGIDVVAVIVDSPDLIAPCSSPGYLCGATSSLPDPNFPPFNNSSWTTGYTNDRSQWIRTNPLNTLGFVGVIGEYTDPFGIFPDFGLAFFDGGGGDFSGFGSARFATNAGPVVVIDDVCTLTTCVADPDTTDDFYTVTIGGTLDTFASGLPDLLFNDMSRMGQPTLTASIETPPSHGSVSVALDGSFVYMHDGSSLLTNSLTYNAMDGASFPSIGTVTINVVVPEPNSLMALVMSIASGLAIFRRIGR